MIFLCVVLTRFIVASVELAPSIPFALTQTQMMLKSFRMLRPQVGTARSLSLVLEWLDSLVPGICSDSELRLLFLKVASVSGGVFKPSRVEV